MCHSNSQRAYLLVDSSINQPGYNLRMSHLKKQYLLDPSVIFLNHGSFGATPRPVFRAYQRWGRELGNQPVDCDANNLFGFLGDPLMIDLPSGKKGLANLPLLAF
jgi:hypothetical protein